MRASRIKMSSRNNLKKDRTKSRFICLAGLVALILAGVFVLSYFSFFPVRGVEFYGNGQLSAGQLKSLMEIRGDEDLLKLKCSRLAEMLLKSPWIKGASIRKEYPGRLLVKVREAEPFALLQDKAKVFIIDSDGRRLEELNGETVPFLPVISSSGGSINPDAFSDALSLVREIRATEISGRPVEITGIDSDRKNLTANIDGISVKVGEGRYSEKLLRFVELQAEIKRRWAGVDYIDLRFQDRVVVKPLKEEGGS
ncbi:MAG: cell division protein FtsQ/DivIB [Thermodesulfovibrionales bacterium]|nr:cell division protein FtsQ/DivIB [Thermodesulfovibrionales bacterium]